MFAQNLETVSRLPHVLRNHQVDIVTLGQYLRPTANHLPVDRWVRLDLDTIPLRAL